MRDALLGRKVTERDWVVVGAEPEDLLKLGYIQVGKDFPVFLHPKTKEEYALARTERKQGKGYTGFICDASKHITLEDDLKRRDLTVNAMAQDTLGNLIDPYDGQSDLENRKLKHISDAFAEDPLRVLRVARFAARYADLGFTVDESTMTFMKSISASGELNTLSKERIWKETEKVLNERSPFVFFQVLAQCHALSECFADIEDFVLLDDAPWKMNRLNAKWPSVSSTSNTPLYIAQSALICLLLNKTELNNSMLWLDSIRAPKSALSLADTLIKTAHIFGSSELSADNLLRLFNTVDVWRKEARFLDAINIICLTQSNEETPQAEEQKQSMLNALNAAKKVSAKDVLHLGYQGPQIKKAIDDKREARISEALKLC